jgi:hypothetical protein
MMVVTDFELSDPQWPIRRSILGIWQIAIPTCFRGTLSEIWGYVGKKQKKVERHELSHKGDQYTFIAMAASAKAIVA